MIDHADQPLGIPKTDDELAEDLARLGYPNLVHPDGQSGVDDLFRTPGMPERLGLLAVGPGSPGLAAFLAAEVLFARDAGFPIAADRARLAEVYAAALRQNFTGMANPWGMPGELAGPVTQHVLALGDAGVHAFAELLTDTTGVRYGGSKEATVGNSFSYRVKDVAASIVAALSGLGYEVHPSPEQRDEEIELLRRRTT